VKARLPLLSLLLAALAATLHLGISRPVRLEAEVLAAQQSPLRAELQKQRLRLQELEREASAQRAALARLGGVSSGDREAVTSVRRALLSSLSSLPVDGVQLSVQPARGVAAANVSLRASLPLQGFVELSQTLTRPGAGIALSRARLVTAGPDLAVEIEGSSVWEQHP